MLAVLLKSYELIIATGFATILSRYLYSLYYRLPFTTAIG
jgi:hypothetical protein